MRLLGFYDYTVILTYMSLISAFAGMILSGKGMNTAAVFCLLPENLITRAAQENCLSPHGAEPLFVFHG